MAKDRIVIPGIPTDAARVIIERMRAQDERLAILERRGGRPGVVTTDTAAKVGELLNIEAPTDGLTIVLPQSTQRLRNARVTLAFRNSNPVRIVCVLGTVNGDDFVLNDRPGTYDAICDGIGGWSVQVGVSEEGSGAGGGGGGFTPSFAVPVDVGTANAEGAATTLARSDHVHKLNFGTPVSVGTANSAGVATTAARADHVHRDRIGTGSDDGFLSLRVYVNASSARVGTTIFGVTALAATTLSAASDLADGNWFLVIVWGGGGSGANGMFRDPAVNTNSLSSGSGGGGGACNWAAYSRAELVAALSIVMTIAADAVATASATTVTTSHSGTNGGPTHFGGLLSAFGGAGGRCNNNTAVSGGTGAGLSHAGVQAVTGTNNLGGGAPAAALPGYGGYGGASSTADGAFSATRGGGGGGGPSASNGAGGAGGRAASGAGGGGGGGGAVDAGTTLASSKAGGAGGLATAGAPASETGGGGTAGAVGTTSLGGDGGDGASSTTPTVGGSGGGGGASASGSSGQGGAGGDGGFPGGGGGGGGSARGVAGTARGGLGGTGAGGAIVIVAYA